VKRGDGEVELNFFPSSFNSPTNSLSSPLSFARLRCLSPSLTFQLSERAARVRPLVEEASLLLCFSSLLQRAGGREESREREERDFSFSSPVVVVDPNQATMAASRKLQQEIERIIKRINEGCDEFDQIWDKVRGLERALARAREGAREEKGGGPKQWHRPKASVVVTLRSRVCPAPILATLLSLAIMRQDGVLYRLALVFIANNTRMGSKRGADPEGPKRKKKKKQAARSRSTFFSPADVFLLLLLSPLLSLTSFFHHHFQVYDPDQAALKEKNEADLKKELKKLQKCRDQIKNWISGNEVKDKTDLLAARRAVERQMERFKVCERESKTKTFSKEGLSLQATKVDPAQARRNDARDWITATVSTLEEECEAFEAEVESLGGGSGGGGAGGGADSKSGGGGGGRRGKAKAIPPRVTHLEASADRHRAHIARLEQLLRLLDNEAVEVEDVEGVRELVDDYLARNQGGSDEAADRASATMTPDEFAEPDDLYEGLLERLDAVEAALPLVPSAVALKAHKVGDEKNAASSSSSSSLATAGSSSNSAATATAGAGAGATAAGGSSSSSAAAKAAAVAAAAKQQLAASGVLRAAGANNSSRDDDDDVSSSAPKTTTVVRRPSTSGAELPSSPAVSRKGALDAPSPLGPGSASGTPAAVPPPPRTAAPWAGIAAATAAAASAAAAASSARGGGKGGEDGGVGGGGPGSASGTPRASSAGGGGVAKAVGGGAAAANGTAAAAAAAPAPSAAATTAAPKPSASASAATTTASQPLAPPMTSATQSPIVPSAPPAVLQSLLAACAPRSIPTPADSSWSRIPPRRRALNGGLDGAKTSSSSADGGSASSPTSPSAASGNGGGAATTPLVVPASYPATRLPVLDNPALFERLDTEALFFAFYHQPGTHQQYLAARELKRQSWRYHKAHGAWFQRHEEPRAAGAEFERGTFVYFDYNVVHDDASAGWCYRLKQDFTFTYDQLEDELQP